MTQVRASALLCFSGMLSAGGPAFAQSAGRASATVAVTANVQPSCAIRVGIAPGSSASGTVLRCHPADVARAVVTTVTVPAGASASTDPVTHVVTIQF